MANVYMPEADYKAACDSIRAKDGSSALIKSGEMAGKIDAITTGKPEQEKTVSVTANGVTEITPDAGYSLSKATVNVDVPSGGGEFKEQLNGLIEGSITAVTSDATVIRESAFIDCASLLTASFPEATEIGATAFRFCASLNTCSFPKVITINHYSFANCAALKSISLNKAEIIRHYGFAYSTMLSKFEASNLRTLGSNTFERDSALITVILRKNEICLLQNINAFSSTPIESGTGYIYVPAALVDQYKAATNWSTYATQIRAIEDYPDITGG